MNLAPDAAARAREALIASLEERARLLALPEAVVDTALAQCPPPTPTAPTPVSGEPTPNNASYIASDQPPGAQAPPLVAAIPESMTDIVRRPPPPPPIQPVTVSIADSPRGATSTTDQAPADGAATTDAEDASARTIPDSMVTNRPVTVGDAIPSGRIIAGYRIDRQIGSGAMGQVYRAVQLSVQRDVAFKVLTRRLAGDPAFRERFLREARAAGQLHHFNLIAVHDVGEADGLMFFSMELVDGQTVKDLLRQGPLSLPKALDIAIQTLRALSYAHMNGIVHRDIKPDNLMVTAAGVVKVADLGLSRVNSQERATSETTQAGTLMGTPHYMSPEQGRDAHAADHRSDLYSLGATLYHMIIGQPPFTGASPVEVVLRASTVPLTFPEPGPPPAIKVALSRLLAKKPQERFLSASEALHELEMLYQDFGPPVSQDQSLRRRRRRLRMQRLAPTIVMTAVAILVLAVFAALVMHFAASSTLSPAKREEIESAQDRKDFRQAQALITADLAEVGPGSGAAASLNALAMQVQDAWAADSQARISAPLAAFDLAMKEERWGDAEQALHVDDEDTLWSAAAAQLAAKRTEFQSRLASLDEKPTNDDAPEPLPGAAPSPTPTTGGGLAQVAAQIHDRQVRSANYFWSLLVCVPESAAQAIDLGRTFNTVGNATLSLDATAMPDDGWHWGKGTLHSINLHQRFTSPVQADENWSLKLGPLQVTVTATGTVLSRDGVTQQADPRTANVIHVQRLGNATLVGLNNAQALSTLQANPPLEFHWSLQVAHRVEVVMRGSMKASR